MFYIVFAIYRISRSTSLSIRLQALECLLIKILAPSTHIFSITFISQSLPKAGTTHTHGPHIPHLNTLRMDFPIFSDSLRHPTELVNVTPLDDSTSLFPRRVSPTYGLPLTSDRDVCAFRTLSILHLPFLLTRRFISYLLFGSSHGGSIAML